MKLRAHQVTIDIDNRKVDYGVLWYPILKAQYTLRWMGFRDVWVLKTQHGWHIRAWSSKPLGFREQFVLRAVIGDDPERLYMDELKPTPLRNTLWMWKDGRGEEYDPADT